MWGKGKKCIFEKKTKKNTKKIKTKTKKGGAQ